MKLNCKIKHYMKMAMQNIIMPLIYEFYKEDNTESNLVLFADAHNSEMPFSMRIIYDEVKRRGYNVKCFFLDYQKSSPIKILLHIINFMKYYSNARCVFICDYYLPVSSCRKREETSVVQLWHSCGILKKFGYSTNDDIPSNYYGNMFQNYTLVTVSSPYCIAGFTDAMNYSNKVIKALGVSRTDIFYDTDYKMKCFTNIRKKYPKSIGKKIALWAPTFRGKASNPYIKDEKILDDVFEIISDEWFLIKHFHPHIQKNSSETKDLSIELYDLFAYADILITDYSSIVFDFLFTKKNIILFTTDYNEYSIRRGFYIDIYKEIPAFVANNKEDLLNSIQMINDKQFSKNIDECFEKYMSSCDGNSTNRILAEVNLI